ncbi:hypothetical protein BJ138DRAFT_1119989 [Hygrophoropsis aurantiaca]|uniref:Uncharacterized protein n=1 Tax=Hygrophoropsis aurantiaca TaxID=72124 RepID=A0ACB7ZSS9_9AGAM|nr:hypothetical protein BJ138DRAFT_1119989 [Hygrophoropsis aurantiaca]
MSEISNLYFALGHGRDYSGEMPSPRGRQVPPERLCSPNVPLSSVHLLAPSPSLAVHCAAADSNRRRRALERRFGASPFPRKRRVKDDITRIFLGARAGASGVSHEKHRICFFMGHALFRGHIELSSLSTVSHAKSPSTEFAGHAPFSEHRLLAQGPATSTRASLGPVLAIENADFMLGQAHQLGVVHHFPHVWFVFRAARSLFSFVLVSAPRATSTNDARLRQLLVHAATKVRRAG